MLARKPRSHGAPEALARVNEEFVEVLRGVSLFAEIRGDDEALRQLAARMESRRYARGDAIIREGQVGKELFVLVSGKASVYKSTAEGEQYKVAVLDTQDATKNAFFGEGAILASDARSATIIADADCQCLMLLRDQFEEFGRLYPQWALPVLAHIARTVMVRMRKMNSDLSLLYKALVAEIRGHE